MSVPCTPMVNFGLQLEDWDEDLNEELEADVELEEVGHKDEDKRDIDELIEEEIILQRKFTTVSSGGLNNRKIQDLLRKYDNLYDIPVGMRGAVYRYWETKLDKEVQEDIRRILKEYYKVVRQTKINKVSFNKKEVARLLQADSPKPPATSDSSTTSASR